jgi:polyhydroxybutyrate depolymerase
MSACQRSEEPPAREDEIVLPQDQLLSSGVIRHFLLHVPPSYDGNPIPLVFSFHGYGSNSQQEENVSGLSEKADEAGFIVVYPDGLARYPESTMPAWYTGPGTHGDADRQFIRDLIEHIGNLYTIDPKRIYASGISNGGGMSDRLACDLSDLFAAIAPVAGAYGFWEDCNPSRPVAVLAFHGLDDNIIPYAGNEPHAMTPPIEDWAAAWAVRNECTSGPEISRPVDTVTTRTWTDCNENAEVILYTLENHGHSWPGSTIMPQSTTSQAVNATDIMWDFFVAHPMP